MSEEGGDVRLNRCVLNTADPEPPLYESVVLLVHVTAHCLGYCCPTGQMKKLELKGQRSSIRGHRMSKGHSQCIHGDPSMHSLYKFTVTLRAQRRPCKIKRIKGTAPPKSAVLQWALMEEKGFRGHQICQQCGGRGEGHRDLTSSVWNQTSSSYDSDPADKG